MSSRLPQIYAWHLTWEFPPVIEGGLGIACEGIYNGLQTAGCNVEVFHPAMMKGHRDIKESYLNEDFSSCDFDSLVDKIISGQSLRGETLLEAVQSFSSWVLGQSAQSLPDVVHAHDWHSMLAAVALKKVHGVPMVLQMHSSQVERVGVFAKRGIQALEQWGLEYADAVIAVSGISAQSLACAYCVSAWKIHVVQNAIDSSSVNLREPDELKTLLFVGRFCSQKSPELVVEIFRRLVQQYPHLRLLMVGRGELLDPMRKLIDFYALQQNVELLGKIPVESVAIVYSRADLLMLPSIAEPFGMVALEAAQAGLAVILSERCGAKEILKSACVVEHRDVDAWVRSVTHLIESTLSYRELVSQLQKEAASRTWRDAAEEILAIYAKVLA
ncbi:glycosyltransferase family 4 protein [Rubritalea profundi]|uniref:glycosyltransferase family 4 protein n=1 Tax=Rubritalea profundi TaxID=1658618 RepID=UPI0013FDA5CA|nr:glycosyltransferase family 4 protein [Rubritalea profundi]